MVLAVVVEDEWPIRMLIVDALMDAGWDVDEFASGERAIEYLDQRRDIGMLVTDIRLTGLLTGWDVAEAYRAAIPKVRICYCSANTIDIQRQVQGSIFISKPCQVQDILQFATSLG